MNQNTYETLLTCMHIDASGPKDCCGCLNGRTMEDGSIEFFCNECGRIVFYAFPRETAGESANA